MKLRIRISVDLNDGQIDPASTPHALKAELAPAIQRAVASAFPESTTINSVTVTRLNIATAAPEPVEAE